MEAQYLCCNSGSLLRSHLSPPRKNSPSSSNSCWVLVGRRISVVGLALPSSSSSYSFNSNRNLIKSSRPSPYGRRSSGYGSDDDDDDDEDDEDDEETDSEDSSDEENSDDRKSSLGAYLSDRNRLSSYMTNQRRGSSARERSFTRDQEKDRLLKINGGGLKLKTDDPEDTEEKERNTKSPKVIFSKLQEELDFDDRWFPLVEYLSTFGFKASHFITIYERHMPCLQINAASARERLEYLMSVGVKAKDMRRILLRQPQILEYTVENNLKVHVAFLKTLGIADTRIGHIITAAPSLFSYNVEQSLKPKIKYLVEEVGISRSDLGKVVQLSPQILVQRIEQSWVSRLTYLSKEVGASRDSVVKMVRKHPQLLHYSIEDGMQPRIEFLRSIGMGDAEIVKVLTSLTQVLSLSLEANLKPKYLYLVNELRNEVKSLTKYPTYLSLSLDQRIRPRHRFLVSLKKVPKGPFPLSSLVPSDESFCQQWAGTSLEAYWSFRETLQTNKIDKRR
ncbi:mitochondrial transcription termination factor family protein [Wolffia australiana]